VHWLDRLDKGLGRIVGIGRWLVLPVALLLFLQWPLRDLVRAYSRDANDLAQWIFALYIGFAFTFATRAGTHLAADAFAHRYSPATRGRLFRIGALVCVVPWSLFILIGFAKPVWQSVLQLEGFPDTYNPGYFLVKLGAWLLALLALLQALLDVARGPRADHPDHPAHP